MAFPDPPYSANAPIVSLSASGNQNSSTNPAINGNVDSDTPHTSAQKLSVLGRFSTFSRSKKTKQALIFPPPSWSVDKASVIGTGATARPDDASYRRDFSEETEAITIENQPDPKYLAQKIRALIDSLPIDPDPVDAAAGNTTTPANDPSGPPVLSIVDSKLIALLSSETVMNGSISRGRESVWSVLEHLRHGKRAGKDGAEDKAGKDVGEDSVMMYAPLVPTNDSEVELADSEIYFDEEILDESKIEKEDWVSNGAGIEKREKDGKGTGPRVQSISGLQDKIEGKKRWKGRKGCESMDGEDVEGEREINPKKAKKMKELRLWVPSVTKISLQAMWWGFRLYLPPPILAILDNTQLVAAKRAAMVTAALKWLLNRIPTLIVPPPLRPALFLLKRLSPYLGYIGIFVAWSWGAIKAHDKGYGVILTATWLLPVALVPTTWEPNAAHRIGIPVQKTETIAGI